MLNIMKNHNNSPILITPGMSGWEENKIEHHLNGLKLFRSDLGKKHIAGNLGILIRRVIDFNSYPVWMQRVCFTVFCSAFVYLLGLLYIFII